MRLAVVVLAGGGSLLMGFLIPAWASHGVMPGRLLNWQYFVLLPGLLGVLLLVKRPVHPTFEVQPTVAAAAFVAMLVLGNPRLAAQDLVLRVPDWSRAKRAALQLHGAHFPQLPDTPHMYFDYDVNNNPSSHPNVCVARYYGLPSIVGPRPETNGADLTGRSFGR